MMTSNYYVKEQQSEPGNINIRRFNTRNPNNDRIGVQRIINKDPANYCGKTFIQNNEVERQNISKDQIKANSEEREEYLSTYKT